MWVGIISAIVRIERAMGVDSTTEYTPVNELFTATALHSLLLTTDRSDPARATRGATGNTQVCIARSFGRHRSVRRGIRRERAEPRGYCTWYDQAWLSSDCLSSDRHLPALGYRFGSIVAAAAGDSASPAASEAHIPSSSARMSSSSYSFLDRPPSTSLMSSNVSCISAESSTAVSVFSSSPLVFLFVVAIEADSAEAISRCSADDC